MSKTALIIGASRGIGLGLAQELAGRGWRVIATRRGPSAELEQAAEGHVAPRLVVDDRGVFLVALRRFLRVLLARPLLQPVLRLGRRVATYPGSETGVEQLVGAMTGALDFHSGQAGEAA